MIMGASNTGVNGTFDFEMSFGTWERVLGWVIETVSESLRNGG